MSKNIREQLEEAIDVHSRKEIGIFDRKKVLVDLESIADTLSLEFDKWKAEFRWTYGVATKEYFNTVHHTWMKPSDLLSKFKAEYYK